MTRSWGKCQGRTIQKAQNRWDEILQIDSLLIIGSSYLKGRVLHSHATFWYLASFITSHAVKAPLNEFIKTGFFFPIKIPVIQLKHESHSGEFARFAFPRIGSSVQTRYSTKHQVTTRPQHFHLKINNLTSKPTTNNLNHSGFVSLKVTREHHQPFNIS